jgi:NADH-quinone oxidoreductase subunit L
MEGPTTVSALIHAATMVKAGVYLTARAFIFLVPQPLLVGSNLVAVEPPWTAILVIAAIGGFTALFAATMAVVNYDIKRVMAFSTISQLAYMFLGLGAGAFLLNVSIARGEADSAGYSAAFYHLFNHAFFKALLFLGAGSVIHAVHTNDMREMGGLRKVMPITSWTMLFGSLALAGIIPFSGFFSKGEILSVTFEAGAEDPVYLVLWGLGVATSFLTAFYVFRMWFMTFRGDYRGHGHLHESPWVMTVPLLVLGAFTLISGLSAYAMGGFGNLIFFESPRAQLPLAGVPLTDYVLEGLTLDCERRRPGRLGHGERLGSLRPASRRWRGELRQPRHGPRGPAPPAEADGPGAELRLGRGLRHRGRDRTGVRDRLVPAVLRGAVRCRASSLPF